MSEIKIKGGKRLTGEIDIQGAKNSVLPVLAATILCGNECTVHNCPTLSDVETSLKILSHLGCKCSKIDNTVVVNSNSMSSYEIPETLMREMRSSVVFLGAIIGKMGKAVISSPVDVNWVLVLLICIFRHFAKWVLKLLKNTAFYIVTQRTD